MKFSSREKLAFLILLVVALSIPLTLYSVKRVQDLRGRAAIPETITVCSSGCDVKDINDAFRAIQAGWIIEIKEDYDGIGLFDGNVITTLNDLADGTEFTIKGQGMDTTLWNNTVASGGNNHLLQISEVDRQLTINIEDVEFSGNQHDATHIHTYATAPNVTVNLSRVRIRNASNAAGIRYDGASKGTILNSEFENNYWPGVSLHDSAEVIISQSTFAIHDHAAVDAADNSKLTVANSTFAENNITTDDNSLGAVYLTGSAKALIRDNYFSTNQKAAIYTEGNSHLTAYRNYLNLTQGVGIYFTTASSGDVSNNIVKGGGGNGITVDTGGDVTLTNNLILENKGTGGIYFKNTGDVVLKNNIVVNNEFDGVFRDDHSGTLTFEYNDVWGNGRENIVGLTAPGIGTLSVDPKLLSNDGYRLAADSPVIDRGDPAVSFNDPDGSRNDLGVWGGGLADSLPSGEIAEDVTCNSSDFTVDIKGNISDPNNANFGFDEEAGYLIVTDKTGSYKYKDITRAAGAAYEFSESIRLADVISPKVGESYKVSLVGYNVRSFSDINGVTGYELSARTLRAEMENGKEAAGVTFTCGREVNEAPVFDPIPSDQNAYKSHQFTYSLTVDDPNEDDVLNVTIEPSAKLSWLNVGNFNQSTKTIILEGTPEEDDEEGKFEVTATVTDGELETSSTFNIEVVDLTPEYPALSLVIDLEFKDVDESNGQIIVKAFQEDSLKFSGVTSSNLQGKTGTLVLTGLEGGEYTLFVKPKGHLSREFDVTLVEGENKITVEEPFLAGDMVDVDLRTYDIVNMRDVNYVYSVYLSDDDLGDVDDNGIVKVRDVVILFKNYFLTKNGESLIP